MQEIHQTKMQKGMRKRRKEERKESSKKSITRNRNQLEEGEKEEKAARMDKRL